MLILLFSEHTHSSAWHFLLFKLEKEAKLDNFYKHCSFIAGYILYGLKSSVHLYVYIPYLWMELIRTDNSLLGA